jgi:hypothetical protein
MLKWILWYFICAVHCDLSCCSLCCVAGRLWPDTDPTSRWGLTCKAVENVSDASVAEHPHDTWVCTTQEQSCHFKLIIPLRQKAEPRCPRWVQESNSTDLELYILVSLLTSHVLVTAPLYYVSPLCSPVLSRTLIHFLQLSSRTRKYSQGRQETNVHKVFHNFMKLK